MRAWYWLRHTRTTQKYIIYNTKAISAQFSIRLPTSLFIHIFVVCLWPTIYPESVFKPASLAAFLYKQRLSRITTYQSATYLKCDKLTKACNNICNNICHG